MRMTAEGGGIVAESCIPIVIGVTGHRNLRKEELEPIRELVAQQLKALQSAYPNSSFRMLNSLAAGADQLCGQIALEQGIPLICPLPMSAEEYAMDFQEEERESFFRLLSRSESFLSPCQEPEQPGRDYRYRQAGLYVASHCHVLLALWDGDEKNKHGCGTAATVQWARSRCKEPDAEAFCSDSVSILQIQVNRAGSETRLPVCERWLDSGLNRELLAQTDRFNAAAKGKTFHSYSPLPCSEDAPPSLRRLLSLYQQADGLSLACQKAFNRSLLAGAVCCVLLVLFYLMYDELDSRSFLILYGVLMAAYALLYRRVHRKQILEGYLQYRLLAETARVQSYITALGFRNNAAAGFTWSQKQDAAWIQFAISAVLIGPETPRVLSDEAAWSLWIRDQRAYHQQAYQKTRRKCRTNQFLCSTSLFCMIAAFFLTFLLEYGFHDYMTGREYLGLIPQSWMKILWGVLSAITLFAADYFGKLSLERKRIDHLKMEELYRRAEESFEDFPEKRSALFQRLAREELIENGNWYSYCQENSLSFDL